MDTVRTLLRRKPRVLIGPLEIAGYYSALEGGLLSLGVSCRFVELQRHPYTYPTARRQPALVRLAAAIRKQRKCTRTGRLIRRMLKNIERRLTDVWLIGAIVRYDVFILSFGRSFAPSGWDLRLMRRLKKRVIVNLGHGSEARAPYLGGTYRMKTGVDTETFSIELRAATQRVATDVRRWESLATIIVGAPLSTATLATRPFVSLYALGIPVRHQIRNPLPKTCHPDDGPVRILHAPSNPLLKGTDEIRIAIANLQARGWSISYEEIQGKRHSEVMEAILRCDFVVDQLWSDTPMAGFAAEAAACAKPSVVGGYGWDALALVLPVEDWPPSATCSPSEAEATIERLVLDREHREHLGQAAREFVEGRWSATEVAQRWLRVILDEIPEEWMFDPHKNAYLYGCGQPRYETRRNVRLLIDRFGIDALEIQANPALVESFITFASTDAGPSGIMADDDVP